MDRFRRSLLVSVLAQVVVALCVASPAQAASVQLRGVDMHVQGGQADGDPATLSREFSMLQAAGATSVRFDAIWANLEWTAKGDYDPNVLASFDYVFQQARAHGLKVILALWGTPCWASSAPASMTNGCSYGWWDQPVVDYPPVKAQDYADIAAFVAQRWGSYLAALELWNEPNGGNFFISSDPSADYARLVEAAYPAVKAVAPSLPVIMSLGGTDTQFLSWLYGYGVKGDYDGIAVHPYGDPEFTGLKAFRAYQLSQGDDAPLWVTEVGWPSTVWGDQGEASNVTSALQQLAALPYVAATEIYDLHDGGTDPSDPQDHFGLLDYSLNPKPAWDAFTSTLAQLSPPAPAQAPPSSTSPPPKASPPAKPPASKSGGQGRCSPVAQRHRPTKKRAQRKKGKDKGRHRKRTNSKRPVKSQPSCGSRPRAA